MRCDTWMACLVFQMQMGNVSRKGVKFAYDNILQHTHSSPMADRFE